MRSKTEVVGTRVSTWIEPWLSMMRGGPTDERRREDSIGGDNADIDVPVSNTGMGIRIDCCRLDDGNVINCQATPKKPCTLSTAGWKKEGCDPVLA